VKVPRVALERFLLFTPKPLSHRAARGFLSRLEASSLRTETWFLQELREYVRAIELPVVNAAA
jgi:hypothetical protein